jgi:toxin ParE1/3/4
LRVDWGLNTATHFDAIEGWIAQDNASAAVALWLLIDDQVEQLADPNFPRRPSPRVAGAYEVVAHENYVVYFDQDDSTCTITVWATVHVARQLPWTLPVLALG